jgi:hypothetical protein
MKQSAGDKLRLSILAALSVTAATPFFPLLRATQPISRRPPPTIPRLRRRRIVRAH